MDAFKVQSTAIPEAAYQWFKNKKPLSRATHSTLILKNIGAADAGTYTVVIRNASGSITSSDAILKVISKAQGL
jgi:hypothetical protein